MTDPTAVPETDKRHALLWALAAFREDLGRLIDEQVAQTIARSAESASPAPPHQVAPPEGPPPATAPEPLVIAAAVPATPGEAEPPPQRAAAPAPRPRPREAAVAAAAEPMPPSRSDDPRQRLDALAKLLDRRLKSTAGEPSVKPPEG